MKTAADDLPGFEYIGTELELFALARNWKRYWESQIRTYLGTRIADIGAGIGTNAALLARSGQEWTFVEPDPTLAARICQRIRSEEFRFQCRVVTGTSRDIEAGGYDTLLYIDVLEHIDDDRGEVAAASQKLRAGGHLVTLSPAHPFLFSPFDAAIGHHRRYTRQSILPLAPATLEPVRVRYLDSFGMLASLANRLVLKASSPKAAEIRTWDQILVPLSRLLDPLTGYRLGKSLLCVWRRVEA